MEREKNQEINVFLLGSAELNFIPFSFDILTWNQNKTKSSVNLFTTFISAKFSVNLKTKLTDWVRKNEMRMCMCVCADKEV